MAAILMLLVAATTVSGAPAAAAATASGTPVGNVDSVVPAAGGVNLRGWAWDNNTQNSVTISINAGSVKATSLANLYRPDVARVYPKAGSYRGFDKFVALPPGVHTICVAALNVGAGVNKAFPCATVTVGNPVPIGNLDLVSATQDGARVVGWAADAASDRTVSVRVGTKTTTREVQADAPRSDVLATYSHLKSGHGFDTTVTLAAGTHEVCVTALAQVSGYDRSLGCKVVEIGETVPHTVASGLPLNYWNKPLAASAPLEDNAALNGTSNGGTPYARRLANMARYHSSSSPVAGYYAYGYNTITSTDAAPVYTVRAGTHRTQKVTWMLNNGTGPEASLTDAWGLQQKFLDVPIPTGPGGEPFESYYGRQLAAAGPDQQLVIYNEATGEMWEMWLFRYNAAKQRYEMGYGGYTADVRTAPIALPHQWGARATSIPLAAGIMLRSEYADGEYRHPLALNIPVVKPGYLAPATREDGHIVWQTVGNDGRDAVPEGAWFRLPAGYPIDTTKPKLWQMIVKAARDYGIVVTDQTGGSMGFAVEATNAIGTPYSSLTVNPMPKQSNHSDGPYYGANNVLNSFPWDDLVQIAYRP